MTDTGGSVEAASFPPPLPVEVLASDTRPHLGSLLLRDGLLTVEQLEWALAAKQESGQRLGEIVVQHGLVPGAALARALAEQHGLAFVDLATTTPDPAAVALLPEPIARRLGALPLELSGETVRIGVADPTNVLASDDLRLALGLHVELVVVPIDDLGARDRPRLPLRRSRSDDVAPAATPLHVVEDVRDGNSGSPAIKLANQLIAQAIEEGASDIHFEPQEDGLEVRARIDGVMRPSPPSPRPSSPR